MAVMTMLTIGICNAAINNSYDQSFTKKELSMVNKPVDMSSWAYQWRSDLEVQKKPEAYFIPRRLERIDKVYRTAYYTLPEAELKSIHYQLKDLLQPLPPSPNGKLLAGLLWVGKLSDYNVELIWKGDNIPLQNSVEVRTYPTSFGWFGWTVDRIMTDPIVSEDKRTWTYKSDPSILMDAAYNMRVPSATEMIAVFSRDSKIDIPEIRITGPDLGNWQRTDVEIEWGFIEGKEKVDFDGKIETHVAKAGRIIPIDGDTGTKVTSKHRFTSKYNGGNRRGIIVPLIYAPESSPGLDSRVTVRTNKSGFTFKITDLDKGPIYIPLHNVFIKKANNRQTVKSYITELKSKNLKSIRQMTKEHKEAQSLDELMNEIRMWTCPEGSEFVPFKEVPDPVMKVDLSDAGWTDAWRAATNQLRGEHMWGGLAYEVGRVAHEMNMIGLHGEADKIYDYFLKSPGVKPDGDFVDGKGALEYATSMRHDMGYNHDGTHSSTGRMLFAIADRYFLTGDKEWFKKNRSRIQDAADWIIRQRTQYLKDIPNRKDLFTAGLMPPYMLGDYAIPTCDWHWYYFDNALSLQAIQRFGDALKDIKDKDAKKYLKEAESFRKDIQRVIKEEEILTPVRLGRDGMYHSYISRMAYNGGLTGPEMGAPQFPDCDMFKGSLALSEPFAVLEPNDPRMIDNLTIMEELGINEKSIANKAAARAKAGLSTDDSWFWLPFVILPKASHNANIFLLQDDIPNFLRFWGNAYASIVGKDGKLWEHWHLGNYDDCLHPDNGTAGWFLENFRNMLVMEIDNKLWIAKGTPRSWLEQGKYISVANAPTYFGTLAYDINSDVDNGKITAVIQIPDRSKAKSIIVRFRHPNQAKIKSVTINGVAWNKFDPSNEIIEIKGLSGKINVTANY